MRIEEFRAAALAVAFWLAAAPTAAQHAGHTAGGDTTASAHAMWMAGLPGGWSVTAMGQVYPIVTIGAPGADAPARETAWYLTQPVAMANLSSPGSSVVVRATLDLEGWTQPDGELTYGSWGESYIDRRHPHTLLHEIVLSLNAWDVAGGAASFSFGRAFTPYGTDDPMSRPVVKYPTNHHLSQILERWMLSGVFVRGGWSIEAGLFGGNEPEDPWDLSNLEPFANSWSARVTRRWGEGWGPLAAWEASLSYGDISEELHAGPERTRLWNAALRHSTGTRYGLIETSLRDPEHEASHFSVLAEASIARAGHQPYARVEYATRPEWERLASAGDDFFRYEHDAAPIGATRWLIATAGYGYQTTRYPFSVRPFAEVQFHRASEERGGIEPETLFGSSTLWSISLGARVFIGGDPMRMGAYGVLDPMTVMHRPAAGGTANAPHQEPQ